jgi:DNA-binding IclR family transcriptional regulator
VAQTNSARGSGARSIALLKLIAEIGDDFTLTEIAERAQLPVSSVHRLLQPLLAAGLVERAGGQRYRAGGEFLRIARMLLQNMDIGRIARPLLRELWDEWQETTVFCLYRPQAHKALILDIIPTPHPLRFVLEPMTEVFLPWGSLGRSILAHLPAGEREAAIKASPAIGPLTGGVLPSKRELDRELAQIRKRGAAVYHSDRIDLAGVAAPVLKADGAVVGSVGISLPIVRFQTRKAAGMIRAVRSAANRLGKLAAGWA